MDAPSVVDVLARMTELGQLRWHFAPDCYRCLAWTSDAVAVLHVLKDKHMLTVFTFPGHGEVCMSNYQGNGVEHLVLLVQQ